MELKFNDNTAIYVQIIDYIKRKIVSNELKGGEKLPSVREMSSKLKVNPNTIQRSYKELEREEIAYTQRGMGTFVTKDEKVIKELKKSIASSALLKFLNEMRELGFEDKEIIEIVEVNLKGD